MSLARLRSLESVELMSAAIEHLVKARNVLILSLATVYFMTQTQLKRTSCNILDSWVPSIILYLYLILVYSISMSISITLVL